MSLADLTWNQFRDVLPVITFALGLGAGLVADHFNDQRQRRRERERWIVEQQAATITELADVLREHSERMQVVVRQRQEAFAESGKWPERVKASDSEWAARSRALVLTERLQDDDLRAEVDRLTSTTTDAALAENALDTEAVDVCIDAIFRWQKVNGRLGVALRELYPA